MTYKRNGITQFLLMGGPDLEEMTLFSQEIVPCVRAMEQQLVRQTVAASPS